MMPSQIRSLSYSDPKLIYFCHAFKLGNFHNVVLKLFNLGQEIRVQVNVWLISPLASWMIWEVAKI